MSAFTERARDTWSRVSLRDRTTQITIASVVVILALIVGIIAWPGGAERTAEQKASIQAAERARDIAAGKVGNVAAAGQAAKSTSDGSATTTGSGAQAGGAQATTPRVNPGANARGITAKEILVGAAYDKNAGALNAAYGFAGIGQIDQKRSIEQMRDYINSQGGIGGRKIRIVWYVADQLSGKNEDQVAQEACATWTQDTHVFAVYGGGTDTLRTCLQKAGVVMIGAGVALFDSQTFKQFPYYVHVNGPAFDRLAKFYVDQLHAGGYYAKGRTDAIGVKGPFKLGVVSWDDPVFDRAIAAYRRALAAHKISLTEVAQVHRYRSAQEIGDSVAGIRAAVLRFKANKVTHVNFLSTANAFEQLTFWQIADQQQYYPRYGISSNDAAQALITTLSAANDSGTPRRTFTQSLGIGWFPLFDVPRADYSGNKELPALRQCKSILKDETWDDAARNKEAIAAANICDPPFYLKYSVEKGGTSVINQRTWLNGVASLGTRPSAATFVMRTTATRHDAMSGIRNYQFYDNCTCFHYTSGTKPV